MRDKKFRDRYAGDVEVLEVLAYPEDEIEEHQQRLHAGHRGYGL